MTLTFNPRNHTYKLDGRPVPGVTTLIGKGVPKPAIPYWSARSVAEFVADHQADIESMWAKGRGPMVAYLKEVPWQKRDDAGLRGTEIHALAEQVVRGEEVEVPEQHLPVIRGYVDALNRHSIVPLLTERPVANRRWWYAGTFDLIATVGSEGETWLCDVKTSAGVYGETALQTAAYANAEFYLDDDGAEQTMPAIDRLGVLHATEHGTELLPVTDPAAAFKDYLHSMWIANAANRIKTYIGEAL